MKALPKEVESRGMEFSTISEIGQSLRSRNTISVPNYTSWADTSRDLSAWLGNDMQRDAFEDLKSLSNCADKETWRYLQTTDHLYYMSLAGVADQEVHSYFNPYGSPYDAYIHFKNIIEDFRLKCFYKKQ
jgi:alpha-amylase